VLDSVAGDPHEASWPLPTVAFSPTDMPLSRCLQQCTVKQALQDRSEAIAAANLTLYTEQQYQGHQEASVDLTFLSMPDSAARQAAANQGADGASKVLERVLSVEAKTLGGQSASVQSHGQVTAASDTPSSLYCYHHCQCMRQWHSLAART
jgi:hypothetical protein